MKITCIDKDIRAVLQTDYYLIPRFQRPYLWDRENVDEFWNDTIVDTEGEHFVGSMVVFRGPSGKLAIVDGQQRLTTATMILCAVRNAFSDFGFDDLSRGTHSLIERPDISHRAQFVLQTETSYPYLQEYIQKLGRPDTKVQPGPEELLLQDAFNYLSANVRTACSTIIEDPSLSPRRTSTALQKKLSEIRDKLLTVKLIFIELDAEDDAYVIFETLNTRGKELRVSDLVKNHLTRLLKPTNVNVDLTKDKWNRMVDLIEESAGEITIDDFLHHFWLSKHNYTTSKKLYKSVKSVVKKTNAPSFLDELSLDAATYREIHETGYRKWTQDELPIRQSLDALKAFRVKQDLPMILSLMRDYKAGTLKRKHVARALAAIENFHFMFTAITSQRSSGGISFMYALHARTLTAAGLAQAKLATLKDLTDKLRNRRPSFQEFEANFAEKLYSKKHSRDKRLIQYILAKIDTYANRAGVPIDYSQMTIEHLLPENPPSRRRGRPVSDEVIAQIGNLILVDKALNDQLANKDFQAKKTILQASSVKLDSQLRQASTWGRKEIEERSHWLAKLAYEKVWSF